MGRKRVALDVQISGQGIYVITGMSADGRRWVDANVQGAEHGTAYCDDVRLTNAIAAGAVQQGLRVVVNGQPVTVNEAGECVRS